MNRWMELNQVGRMTHIAMVAVLAVLLTGCIGGGDEEEPTATSGPSSAQPTVVATGSDAGERTESTPEENVAAADTSSSGSDTGTPQDAVTGSPAAINDTADSSESASPTAGESTESTPETAASLGETTDTDTADQASTAEDGLGDGTTGAASTPESDEPVDLSQATPQSVTPGATPVAGATPAANATPDGDTSATLVGILTRVAPPVVESCDVTDVPEFTAEITTYMLTSDLNFRAGPGSDCDLIGDGPLGEFSAVDIIGGPVVREGDDSGQWVQVQVGNQTGWLVLEFLEPAG